MPGVNWPCYKTDFDKCCILQCLQIKPKKKCFSLTSKIPSWESLSRLESSLETRNVLQNFFFLFLQGDCILLPFSTEFLLVTLASASTFSWYSFSESTTKPKLPKSTGPTIKNFLLQLYYRVIIISYCYLTCFFHAYDAC